MTFDERATLERIANRIAQARARAGLTLTDIARRSGVERERFAGIESGEREPSMVELIRIARAMNTHPASLME